MKILFVCTGNTCRSPMAELIFKDMIKNYSKNINCDSAGLSAVDGMDISKNALIALKEIGIDASGKKAKNISSVEDIEDIDLFVAMTVTQAKLLLDFKIPSERIYILGGGIPDPYGMDLDEYRMIMGAIKNALVSLLDELKGKNSGRYVH